MLMEDLNIKNGEFIELLDELSKRATNLIENRSSIVHAGLDHDVSRQDPVLRKQNGHADPYKHSPDWDILPIDWRDLKEGEMDPCGKEYLDYQLEQLRTVGPKEDNTCGWPNKEIFTGAFSLEKNIPDYMRLPRNEQLHEITRQISYDYLGGSSIALTAIYPPGGYIPWHNNGNAPGHNLLLHYSLGGDGEFITYHDNEFITYKDKDREWIARAGAFLSTQGPKQGSNDTLDVPCIDPFTEPEKASWHCARTSCWRITLSTIIPQREMWELVKEELQEE